MQLSKKILRGRAGLHLWAGPAVEGDRGSYWELPQDISTEDLHVTLGIGSVTVFSCGSAELWQCRLSSYVPSSSWQLLCLPKTRETDGGGAEKVRHVAAGLSHCLVCSDSGRAYSSGFGYFGQTGQSSSTGWSSLSEVKGFEDGAVTQVVCGLDHSLFLLGDGRVFACGWSADGQTGIGSYESSGQLKQVQLGSNKVVSVATCSDSSFALTDTSQVLGWGNNEYRQLGVASEEAQLAVPEVVECSAMDGSVVSIAAGGAFTAFLTCEGSVYVAGYGIGMGQASSNSLLRKVHCGKEEGKMARIDAGLNYLLAQSDSTVLIWGKLQLPNHHSLHYGTKCTASPAILHLACGPVGLAAIIASTDSEILSLQ